MSVNRSKLLGFVDLNPNQVAHQLLGHLKGGDWVAITTRRYDATIQSYVQTLQQQRGFHVRVIQQSTGIQDFCFLRYAQKELIGHVRSTYAVWAALLSVGRNTRMMPMTKLYIVDDDGLRRRFGETNSSWDRRFSYAWTNPQLRYIQFLTFSSTAKGDVGK